MNLLDLLQRASPPEPWVEGDKIPWHDPDFSRRTIIVEEQVEWIHQQVLNNRSSRVLDLGCGPGLYSCRLAQHLACDYRLADLRHAEYGAGYDLAMFIFGEFNPSSMRRRSTFCAKPVQR